MDAYFSVMASYSHNDIQTERDREFKKLMDLSSFSRTSAPCSLTISAVLSVQRLATTVIWVLRGFTLSVPDIPAVILDIHDPVL